MERDAAAGLNGPAARAPVSSAFVPCDLADVTQPLAWRFEQCARGLARAGRAAAGPHDPVGLCLPRRVPADRQPQDDRKRLPPPGRERPALAAPHVVPQTPTEQARPRTWRAAIGLEEVGRDDPFSGLGGHSLQAMRIIAEVPTQLRIELPLGTLFEAPTIAATAAEITAHQAHALDPDRLQTMLRELDKQYAASASARRTVA